MNGLKTTSMLFSALSRVRQKTMSEKLPNNPKSNLKKGFDRTGIPNKNTKALKEMILGALEKSGGEAYLCEQAEKNPTAFLTLIGKVLPSEIKADVDFTGDIVVKWQR